SCIDFQKWGFVVEKERYDRQAETTHVIGVYATKQEAFELITVAVECKKSFFINWHRTHKEFSHKD
ncbi:MAG: hypothetical protein ACUVUE_05385, partial [Candidatus Bathycorpusculaceae bacterium]